MLELAHRVPTGPVAKSPEQAIPATQAPPKPPTPLACPSGNYWSVIPRGRGLQAARLGQEHAASALLMPRRYSRRYWPRPNRRSSCYRSLTTGCSKRGISMRRSERSNLISCRGEPMIPIRAGGDWWRTWCFGASCGTSCGQPPVRLYALNQLLTRCCEAPRLMGLTAFFPPRRTWPPLQARPRALSPGATASRTLRRAREAPARQRTG